MEENAKVFVFEKKEIFLIFVFVVIMSVTCFTLGVNLGKKLALEKSGVTEVDTKTVEMKSTAEEDVEETLAQPQLSDEEKLKQLMEESKEKLNTELQQFGGEEKKVEAGVPTTSEVTTATKETGKYTIQLGSYSTMEDAKQFAEGFTVRGYNPTINEVIIAGKGTWYRVSLGLFANVQEAKDYVKKEATLFQGQDYVISEIK
ncbi:MAG: SPOR domain-containing protein [Bacteriovoracia bacterium]